MLSLKDHDVVSAALAGGPSRPRRLIAFLNRCGQAPNLGPTSTLGCNVAQCYIPVCAAYLDSGGGRV